MSPRWRLALPLTGLCALAILALRATPSAALPGKITVNVSSAPEMPDLRAIHLAENRAATQRLAHEAAAARQRAEGDLLNSEQQASPPASLPASSPVPVSSGSYGTPPAWFTQCVIQRESGGDPTAYNASTGASGLFGFLLSTWDGTGVGYPGGAYTAPASVQYRAFYIEYAAAGTAPWAPSDGC